MSGTIRINQRLREGYNPDGTPGTVSTGAPGVPGRPPTAAEIAAAVTAYLAANPLTVDAVTSSAREENRFGAGANGAPGTYVDLGSFGKLHGFVRADGTPQTVNLYLDAKSEVITSTSHRVMGTLIAEAGLQVRNATGGYDDLIAEVASLQAAVNTTATPPDFVAQFNAALTS